MIRLLGDAGSLYENEKRIAFGLMPLPELQGIRMQSLNYVNVDSQRVSVRKARRNRTAPKEGNNE